MKAIEPMTSEELQSQSEVERTNKNIYAPYYGMWDIKSIVVESSCVWLIWVELTCVGSNKNASFHVRNHLRTFAIHENHNLLKTFMAYFLLLSTLLSPTSLLEYKIFLALINLVTIIIYENLNSIVFFRK